MPEAAAAAATTKHATQSHAKSTDSLNAKMLCSFPGACLLASWLLSHVKQGNVSVVLAAAQLLRDKIQICRPTTSLLQALTA